MKPAPDEVARRLGRASELSELSAEQRLSAKIDLSPTAVRARLREASDLLDLCLRLRSAAPRHDP